MCGSRGGGGGGGGLDPHEKSQNIGFLINAVPDPLKNHNSTHKLSWTPSEKKILDLR